MQELIAQAKAEPGKLSFASSGVGNSDHLCGELFNLMAGIQAIHVPYKGGAPAALDVMGGRIAYYFAGMPVGLPLAKSGKARALAVTSKTRFTGYAGDADARRAGPAGLRGDALAGLLRAVVDARPRSPRASPRDIEAVLRVPATRDRMRGAGVSLFEADHATFKRYFLQEIEKWRGVVKKAGLKLG